jgi:hypothetical protein
LCFNLRPDPVKTAQALRASPAPARWPDRNCSTRSISLVLPR